jgi:hypothetical protein
MSYFCINSGMAAIIIKTKSTKHLKLLAELAESMGEKAEVITETQTEDIALGMLMKKAKTGKSVSRNTIFNQLNK